MKNMKIKQDILIALGIFSLLVLLCGLVLVCVIQAPDPGTLPDSGKVENPLPGSGIVDDPPTKDLELLARFDLGSDRVETGYDEGLLCTDTSLTYSSNDYLLWLTNLQYVHCNAHAWDGKSVLYIGTPSQAGGFHIQILDENVKYVKLYVSGWIYDTSYLVVNDSDPILITTWSSYGQYTELLFEASEVMTFMTTSVNYAGNQLAIDTIEFYG